MNAQKDAELTVKEVAAYCGVNKQTVWNWLLAKPQKLKGHRVETAPDRKKTGSGVEWRIYASDLAEFIENRNSRKESRYGR